MTGILKGFMWPRGSTTGTGVDEEKLTQALVKALQNEAVQALLQQTIGCEIRRVLKEMKELINEQNIEIRNLENEIEEICKKNDDLEQYSRRNTWQIFDLVETEHENRAEVTLKLTNSDLGISRDVTSIDRVHRVGKKVKGSKTRPF